MFLYATNQFLSGGVDSCKGDSGGPLFLEIDGQGVVIGITSWYYKGAKPLESCDKYATIVGLIFISLILH